jgi:hypothetical protein
MIERGEDSAFAPPSLTAQKLRALELVRHHGSGGACPTASHIAIVHQPLFSHFCRSAARASLAAAGLIRQRSSQPVGSLVTLRRTSSAGIQ